MQWRRMVDHAHMTCHWGLRQKKLYTCLLSAMIEARRGCIAYKYVCIEVGKVGCNMYDSCCLQCNQSTYQCRLFVVSQELKVHAVCSSVNSLTYLCMHLKNACASDDSEWYSSTKHKTATVPNSSWPSVQTLVSWKFNLQRGLSAREIACTVKYIKPEVALCNTARMPHSSSRSPWNVVAHNIPFAQAHVHCWMHV